MSWAQLKAIVDQARQEQRDEERKPPVACPHCGAVLDVREGVRNCPLGHYRWP